MRERRDRRRRTAPGAPPHQRRVRRQRARHLRTVAGRVGRAVAARRRRRPQRLHQQRRSPGRRRRPTPAACSLTAESVADAVVAPGRLPQVLPCAAGGGEACAGTYLDTIGRRLYRRPLTEEERAALPRPARPQVTGDGTTSRPGCAGRPSRWCSRRSFVYRSELGERDGGGYRLDRLRARHRARLRAHRRAARRRAARRRRAAASSTPPTGVAAAARDLAIDPATGHVRAGFAPAVPRLHRSVARPVVRWPTWSRAATLFPGFSAQIRAAMQRETEAFVDHVVFEERGGVAELLTSADSVVDPALAAYYGWPATGRRPRSHAPTAGASACSPRARCSRSTPATRHLADPARPPGARAPPVHRHAAAAAGRRRHPAAHRQRDHAPALRGSTPPNPACVGLPPADGSDRLRLRAPRRRRQVPRDRGRLSHRRHRPHRRAHRPRGEPLTFDGPVELAAALAAEPRPRPASPPSSPATPTASITTTPPAWCRRSPTSSPAASSASSTTTSR